MSAKIVKEKIPRGDGRDYQIIVTDEDGSVVDISGAKLWFTLKESLTDSDANAEFQLTTDDASEISISDPDNGVADIFIKNIHTSELSIKSYFIDVQIKEVGRELRTLVLGTMDIIPDVTLSIS